MSLPQPAQIGKAPKIGVAILGLGRWGVHWLRNFLQNPGAEVVAVCDPYEPNLDRAATQFDLPASVLRTTDWREAIAHPGVSAVVVVTPATTHAEVVAAALDCQRHVLVEKPLTLTVASAQALCEQAQKVQRLLMVDHNYLFHTAVMRGAGAMESLGNLRYGYGTRSHLGPVRSDVDVMWDLAIHDVAIFNHWLGATPVAVTAQGQSWLQSGLADVVWATLLYENGFEVRLHWAWNNCDKQRRACVVGDRGTMVFDELAAERLVIQRGQLGHGFAPEGLEREVLELGAGEPLAMVCDHFLASVGSGEVSLRSSGWVGLDLVKVLVGLSESILKGGTRVYL